MTYGLADLATNAIRGLRDGMSMKRESIIILDEDIQRAIIRIPRVILHRRQRRRRLRQNHVQSTWPHRVVQQTTRGADILQTKAYTQHT